MHDAYWRQPLANDWNQRGVLLDCNNPRTSTGQGFGESSLSRPNLDYD